ncbi:MAG TPA: hypothetical protein VGT40_23475 [Methylomirabilota bacterium]|nr:hypothetical protein [Methylomirabilota bacterium]
MANARPPRGRRLVRRLEITGGLDRRAIEALALELRRLAKRCGLEVAAVRIEAATDRRALGRRA